MKFFTKSDDRFVLLADDSHRRTLEINRLKGSRMICFFIGLLMFATTCLANFHNHDKGWGAAFFGMICFVLAFKNESDIRTLRIVDHLQKQGVARTA